MKWILVLAALIFSFQGFSQTELAQEKINYSKDNFKVQYPGTWLLDTSRMMGTEFFIFSPLQNEADKFRENVSFIIQNLAGQNIDLLKYKEITEGQITQMATEGIVFESVIGKSEKGEFYKMTYAMTQGKYRVKITSLCYIKNDKAYLVTFVSEFDKYDEYKKDGEGILNSFSFTK